MMEMIRERRNSEKKEERYDLFSSLLDASDDTSDGEVALADSELVGSSNHLQQLTNGTYWVSHHIRQHFHFSCCWTRGTQ